MTKYTVRKRSALDKDFDKIVELVEQDHIDIKTIESVDGVDEHRYRINTVDEPKFLSADSTKQIKELGYTLVGFHVEAKMIFIEDDNPQ